MGIRSVRELLRHMFGEEALKAQVAPSREMPKEALRVIDTRRGGPNRPKYQPCPACHSRSKRESKTMGGANYKCRHHGKFFVRASSNELRRAGYH